MAGGTRKIASSLKQQLALMTAAHEKEIRSSDKSRKQTSLKKKKKRNKKRSYDQSGAYRKSQSKRRRRIAREKASLKKNETSVDVYKYTLLDEIADDKKYEKENYRRNLFLLTCRGSDKCDDLLDSIHEKTKSSIETTKCPPGCRCIACP